MNLSFPSTLNAKEAVNFNTLLNINNNLDKLVYKTCEEDFLQYVKKFAPLLVEDFLMGRHIELISKKLMQLENGEIKRLMVFLPPRSSKSLVCSKLFPSWYIGRHPNHEIMSISHSDQLASDFGRSVRDLVNEKDYKEVFPEVSLRQDVAAAGKWMTNGGGSYYAAGVRGQVAGRGAHIAILDDAMSEEDAISPSGRKYIKQWYPAGLRTRLMPNGKIVIINTRYHYDDLCGWLLEQEKKMEDFIKPAERWNVVSIPAWINEECSELLGLPVGSSYFPEWKPDSVLQLDEREIRSVNGTKYWNSLYMQSPTPDEGGIVKKNWIKRWKEDEPPPCDFILQTYDTAFSTKNTADYSVIQTWGIFNTYEDGDDGEETVVANIVALGQKRDRYEYPDLRRVAQEEYKKHRPDVCLVEKKASGQSLIQDMRRAGLPVLEYMPDRDKTSRLTAVTPLFESGRIFLPEKIWVDDLITELVTFPNAPHDDQVDALVMAALYLKDSWRVQHKEDKDWSDDESPRKQKRVGYWRA